MREFFDFRIPDGWCVLGADAIAFGVYPDEQLVRMSNRDDDAVDPSRT